MFCNFVVVCSYITQFFSFYFEYRSPLAKHFFNKCQVNTVINFPQVWDPQSSERGSMFFCQKSDVVKKGEFLFSVSIFPIYKSWWE